MLSRLTFKLNSSFPEVKALLIPEVLQLCHMFEKKGFEIRVVGGAVRDVLMRKTPKDIDLSTTATPEKMIEVFRENKVKYIETGLQHGTITAHINGKNFEVTTLRVDIETYGRQAKVAFTNDWVLDADRRDLTFNAMSVRVDGTLYDYFEGQQDLSSGNEQAWAIDANLRDLTVNSMSLDEAGTLYDYFNGRSDLEEGKVRFVGLPERRIREDYLRILRYFRFYGLIAKESSQHDQHTIEVIKDLSSGLKQVAVERIWVELSKILVGDRAPNLVRLIYELGVGQSIGLLKCTEKHFNEFERVWNNLKGYKPHAVTLLVALVDTVEDAEAVSLHLKLSNFEKNLGRFIVSHRGIVVSPGESLKPYQDIVVAHSNSKTLEAVVLQVIELLRYEGKASEAEAISKWTVPKFPLTGQDLKKAGLKPGPVFGKVLLRLKELWMESYYSLDEHELLQKLDKVKMEVELGHNLEQESS